MNKMNEVKDEIFKILNSQDLIYCETIYDGEGSEAGVWLYDFCIYDNEDKIDKIEDALNEIKYVGATTSPNMDDGDYSIECIIDLNNENICRDDVLETVLF